MYQRVQREIKYVCSVCGIEGHKLWRRYQTMACYAELSCGKCAYAREEKPSASYLTGEGCEINGMVPAILTPDKTTFWGYTSIPQEQVVEWYGLPCTLRPKSWHVGEDREGNFSSGPQRVVTWLDGGMFKVRQWGNDPRGFWVERQGMGYKGQYVQTIPELLDFLASNTEG